MSWCDSTGKEHARISFMTIDEQSGLPTEFACSHVV